MKSKPVYQQLAIDTSAKYHLFIVEEKGLSTIARALREYREHVNAKVLYVPSGERGMSPALDELEKYGAMVYSTSTELHDGLYEELKIAGMGAAYYVAGAEAFLWAVTKRLTHSGAPMWRIRQELIGGTARTVYCVHCGELNYAVATPSHRCGGCGAVLAVRDHFSRPLGAYMGVVDNVETASSVTEARV